MSYRLIDANALAMKCKEVNDMPCIYVDLPNGLDDGYYDLARAERTCHDANTRFNVWTCSECKCTQLLMFDDYGEPTLNVDGVASVPNYCPNCGAKVVGE